MNLYVGGGLGDELCITGVIREIRRAMTQEIIKAKVCNFKEIFDRNPRLIGGTTDNGKTIILHPEFMGPGNMVTSFCKQVGIKAIDDRPEIYPIPQHVEYWSKKIPNVKSIAIDTFSSHTTRQWPYDRFVAVVDELRKNGWFVVEVGRSIKDCDGKTRPSCLKSNLNMVNKTNISECAALLKACSLYFGADSGLSHLAAAVDTKQITMFGNTKWYHRAYRSTFSLYSYYGGCHDCQGMRCSKPEKCINQIKVDDVLQMIEYATKTKIADMTSFIPITPAIVQKKQETSTGIIKTIHPSISPVYSPLLRPPRPISPSVLRKHKGYK